MRIFFILIIIIYSLVFHSVCSLNTLNTHYSVYQRIDNSHRRHLNADCSEACAVASRVKIYRADIQLHIAAHHLGNLIYQTCRVVSIYRYRNAEGSLRILAPFRLHYAVRILLTHTLCIRAVGAVDCNPRI